MNIPIPAHSQKNRKASEDQLDARIFALFCCVSFAAYLFFSDTIRYCMVHLQAELHR